MYLRDIKKSSPSFDATHKVAIYDDSKTSNEIPKWFNKFYEAEFKPLKVALIKSQTEVPVWFDNFIQHTFKPTIQDLLIEMRKGFAQVNARIDNLVAKNNLKE